MSLSDRNPYEVNAELVQRVEHLERAVLLLANHVGAVGWNYELQQALDPVREQLYPASDVHHHQQQAQTDDADADADQ